MSTGKQEQCAGKFRMIFPCKYLGAWIPNISGHVQKEGSMKTLQVCTALIIVVFTEITFFWCCILVRSPWMIHLEFYFPMEYSMGMYFGNIWKWLHFISTSAELLRCLRYFWIANSYHTLYTCVGKLSLTHTHTYIVYVYFYKNKCMGTFVFCSVYSSFLDSIYVF